MTTTELYNQFCEAAYLDRQHDPWLKRREKDKVYADILIAETCMIGVYNAWWNDFIGLACLAELRIDKCKWTGKTIIKEAVFVRLMNTKVHHGRSISANHFIIL
jgi:hypothetical protein